MSTSFSSTVPLPSCVDGAQARSSARISSFRTCRRRRSGDVRGDYARRPRPRFAPDRRVRPGARGLAIALAEPSRRLADASRDGIGLGRTLYAPAVASGPPHLSHQRRRRTRGRRGHRERRRGSVFTRSAGWHSRRCAGRGREVFRPPSKARRVTSGISTRSASANTSAGIEALASSIQRCRRSSVKKKSTDWPTGCACRRGGRMNRSFATASQPIAVRVIPQIINTERFSPPAADRLHDGPLRLCYVGNREPRKGISVSARSDKEASAASASPSRLPARQVLAPRACSSIACAEGLHGHDGAAGPGSCLSSG